MGELSKSGIQMYYYLINQPDGIQEVDLTLNKLMTVNITKNQFYRGLEELCDKHYIEYNKDTQDYNFYYKKKME